MNKTVIFPEEWDEVTPKQFKWILDKMCQRMPMKDLKIIFADMVLGERRPFNKDKRIQYFALIEDLANSLEWMFNVSGNSILLNFDTTVNPIPKIKNNVGPKSHGSDLRFGEFREAIAAYNDYTNTLDITHLDRLTGILYRKKNKNSGGSFDGNYRIPFNRHNIGKYISWAKSVPFYLKWGVYLWFASFCRYLLSGGIFIIDGKEISFKRVFGKSKESVGTDIGMNSILFTMADAGTFGKAEDIENTELFRILLKLLYDANTYDELEKKYKK